MLDSGLNNAASTSAAAEPRRVLRWVENERMGGKIPVWETKTDVSAKERTELKLSESSINNQPNSSFAQALTDAGRPIDPAGSEPFGLGDIVDMFNPLHHLPVVGAAYRSLTGDTIKPISKIIGGAAFGGPLGAAGNLANVVLTEETGKDMAAHAAGIFAPSPARKPDLPDQDTARTLLSFSDLGKNETGIAIHRLGEVDERMAGSVPHYDNLIAKAKNSALPEPANEIQKQKQAPITHLAMADPPPVRMRYSYND